MAFFPKKGERSTQSKNSSYSQFLYIISLSANNIDVLHTRKIMLHRLFSSFIMLWIRCSSTPLKKVISASAVLITQPSAAVYSEEWNEVVSVENTDLQIRYRNSSKRRREKTLRLFELRKIIEYF